MAAAFQQRLRQSWKQRGALSWALLPVALVYGALAALRRQLYRSGLSKSQQVGVPVIVVGNVVAGGSGKTPVTMALVEHLRATGKLVGVVSRGYGRASTACLEVTATSTPQEVGDEPLLIHHKTGAPVFVASQRAQAAKALLQRYPKTDVILCDDGLQHYALFRNIEICVFDDRGTGNDRLLPAGPLREHWPRSLVAAAGQSSANSLVLHSGSAPAFDGFRGHRALSDHGVLKNGEPISLAKLAQSDAPARVALAGTSQPEEFFAMLRAQGVPLAETLALPDHYDFDSYSGSIYLGHSPICTEKDALKLWKHAPDAIAVPLVFTLEPAFLAALDQWLEAIPAGAHAGKLSSSHGHTIT